MATSDTVGAIGSLVITGATSFFVGKILSFTLDDEIASVPRTPLDRTSGGMTNDVGRLASWTMSGQMIFDPGQTSARGTKGSTVLTWADAATSTLTWSTGFVRRLSRSVSLEEGMVADFELVLNGEPS